MQSFIAIQAIAISPALRHTLTRPNTNTHTHVILHSRFCMDSVPFTREGECEKGGLQRLHYNDRITLN